MQRNQRLVQTTEIVGKVASSTRGKFYEICKGADGVMYCKCPAWAFGKAQGKPCKHMSGIMMGTVKLIAVAQPPVAPTPVAPVAPVTHNQVASINRALLMGTMSLTQSGMVTGDIDDVL